MTFGAAQGHFKLSYDENRAKQFMHIYERLVEESWSNPELRERLKSDLSGVLEENGFDTEGFKFVAYETDYSNTLHLPLPQKPTSDVLSEEQLSSLSEGSSSAACAGTAGTMGCPAGSASTSGSAGSYCAKPKKNG
ncbi:thiocillin family RiPP [Synechococcus sp. UW179A]|uniref:thiocillin family RiPP n=1 Tax=Synechococcus sp. UW179A TaxID=2575510 RepID=UPI000E0EB0DB|nr:thiocillin family RiPP [Synechococcus sp. UW179A]